MCTRHCSLLAPSPYRLLLSRLQLKPASSAATAAATMIKRCFYNVEHGDGDSASSSSLSPSDSEESGPEGGGGEREDDDQRAEEKQEKEVAAEEEQEGEKPASESPWTRSSSSGYESEDSSGNEISCDSTGLLVNDCDVDSGKDRQNVKDKQSLENYHGGNKGLASKNVSKTIDSEEYLQSEKFNCVLRHKSVFKCRICPRIVCLSEVTLLAHLKSKRHDRSKKLLGEGRLKLMLNSNGEIEEEEETHAERHARTVALVQPKRKNKGRQRQSKRRKTKVHNGNNGGLGKSSTKKAEDKGTQN